MSRLGPWALAYCSTGADPKGTGQAGCVLTAEGAGGRCCRAVEALPGSACPVSRVVSSAGLQAVPWGRGHDSPFCPLLVSSTAHCYRTGAWGCELVSDQPAVPGVSSSDRQVMLPACLPYPWQS